ncbi:outer membrane protein [Legionella oakridgensis]|uniref:outer membrane protein n=1 Tax=Legionella oakridgensis TaxID=29423 RepID=UPI0003DE2FA4|nr:outer membrane beta-barrel protein [Legionella oakridgensis]ETO94389.1 outer membrane protein [Legionella oakridgensis RV-2-2007]
MKKRNLSLFVLSLSLAFTTNAGTMGEMRSPFDGFYAGAELGESIAIANESVVGSGNATIALGGLFEVSGTIPLSIKTNISKEHILGAIYGGYGHAWKHLYLGGELTLSWSDYSMRSRRNFSLDENLNVPGAAINIPIANTSTDIVSYPKISPTQFAAAFRPGFLLDKNALLYGRVGFTVAKIQYAVSTLTQNTIFTAPSTPITSIPTSSKRSVFLQLGGGLEYAMINQLSLRADYVYTYYGKLQNNTASSNSLIVNDGGVLTHVGSADITGTNNIKMHDHALTLGLAYHWA